MPAVPADRSRSASGQDAAECHRSLLFDALFEGWARVDLEPAILPPKGEGTQP